jgi:hypothetical protein
MANTKSANVLIVDTSAQFDGVYEIKSIKYIGAASGTASIKADSTSGTVVWEEAGSSNVWNPDVCLRVAGGFYVTLANSAKLYIYLK